MSLNIKHATKAVDALQRALLAASTALVSLKSEIENANAQVNAIGNASKASAPKSSSRKPKSAEAKVVAPKVVAAEGKPRRDRKKPVAAVAEVASKPSRASKKK